MRAIHFRPVLFLLSLAIVGGAVASCQSATQPRLTLNPSSPWHVETVGHVEAFEEWSDMAIDAAGHPHLSYMDSTTGELKYTNFDGARWHTQTPADGCVGYTSLALDAHGYPHISYYAKNGTEYLEGNLKYAYFDGSGWQVEVVDEQAGTGFDNSLVLDSKGSPHISYYALNSTSSGGTGVGQLRYAYRDDNGWQFEVIDAYARTGARTSLALDSADQPHIVYGPTDRDMLNYVYLNGDSWNTETLISERNDDYAPSLVLDQEGKAHLVCSYVSLGGREYILTYSQYLGNTWHSETIRRSFVGGGFDYMAPLPFASLALDSDGQPHIAYISYAEAKVPFLSRPENPAGELDYVYWDGATWQTEVIDDSGDIEYYVSLAVDAAGNLHIGYYDQASGDIKYGYRVHR